MADKPRLPNDDEFLRVVQASDELTLVIRCHQMIESFLNVAISEALPVPHILEVRKLPFALKIDLGVALGIVKGESRTTFIGVNNLRNNFAHSAEAQISKKRARDLFNGLSKFMRGALRNQPFEAFSAPRDFVGLVYTVLYGELKSAYRGLRERMAWDTMMSEYVHEILERTKYARQDEAFERQYQTDLQERFERTKKRLRIDDN